MNTINLLASVALLLACLFILWLVWANQRLHAIIKELEDNNANLYECGVVHGRREATEQYQTSIPYVDGYTQGHADGYTTARDELIAIATDVDTERQRGSLKRC